VILLDTHIWVWWVAETDRLQNAHRRILERTRADEVLGVSIISCWEVAKLVERGRLALDRDVQSWIELALSEPRIRLVHLHPRIAVESTRLPGSFHRDPADQLLVATARVLDCAILSADGKIGSYPYVRHAELAQ
jgi:PIN domain nuclease of toxin-antitoxin system